MADQLPTLLQELATTKAGNHPVHRSRTCGIGSNGQQTFRPGDGPRYLAQNHEVPLKRLIPKLALFFLLVLAACDQNETANTVRENLESTSEIDRMEQPTPLTAYISEHDDLNVVTRFRDRNNSPRFAPSEFERAGFSRIASLTNSIRVEFSENHFVCHGDPDEPVYCLLLDVRPEKTYYGIYAMWGKKSNMEMPLPTHESSIASGDTPASEVLVGSISSIGFSSNRALEIFNEHCSWWMSPGLRALIFTEISMLKNGKPTILCIEYLASPN